MSQHLPIAPGVIPNRRCQTGLSLVELMIGMVLGLIIIAAIFNIYTGTSRSARFTEGLQTMQENGRYGVSILQRSFRLAGYSPMPTVNGSPLDAIDMTSSSDTTIVTQSQLPFDCNGSATTTSGGVAINTYTLNTETNQLTCKGNVGNTAMPVVDGVEEFRVLYGVDGDGDETSTAPQRYVPYDSSLASNEVVALRFALLVNSGKPIRSRNISEQFVVLDKQVDRDDRQAREVFASTVLLRNR